MKKIVTPNTSMISIRTSATTLMVGNRLKVGPQHVLAIVLLAVILVATVSVPGFAGFPNLVSILSKASYIGIVACGMTLLISTGAFDLSVAGIVATSAVILAKVLTVADLATGVVAALLAGALLGFINGMVVTRLRINAFIATFGMMNVYLATAFIILNDKVQGISNVNFLALGTGRFLGIPLVFFAFLGTLILFYFITHRTELGRQFRALGSSEPAAKASGLPIDRIKVMAFVLSGIACGIAAVFLAARLSSASASMSTGVELEAITIAVLGGTSLKGGNATMFGTFVAALLITTLQNVLNLLHVSSYWQYVATGVLLVFALIMVARKSNIADWR